MADTTTRIYELQVKLAAESLRQLQSVSESAKKGGEALDSLVDKAKELGGELFAGFTIDKFVEGIVEAVKHINEMGAAAARVGIDVEKWNELAFAANQVDVNVSSLETGLIHLQKSMVDTSSEGGKALKALGVDALQPVDKALEDLATRFKGIEDPALKSAAALAIFSKSGADMKPLLEKGGEGIIELTEFAKKFSDEFGKGTAETFETIEQNFKKIGYESQAANVDIATGLAPTLLNLQKILLDTAFDAKAFQQVGEALGFIMRTLANSTAVVIYSFKILGAELGAFTAAIAAAATGDFAAAMKIRAAAADDAKKSLSDLGDLLRQINTEQKLHVLTAEEVAKQTAEQAAAEKKLREELEKNQALIKARQEAERAWNEEKQKAAELLKTSRTDLEKYADAVAAANKYLRDGLYDEAQRMEVIQKAAGEYVKATAASEELTKAEKARKEMLDSLRTPMEVALDQFAKYEVLLDGSAEGQEAYNRAVKKTAEEWQKSNDALIASQKHLQGTDKLLDDLANNLPQYGAQISSTLVDFATNAGNAQKSFSDMVTSILSDIAKMVTQVLIITPLMNALKESIQSTAASGGGGLAGFAKAIFASANGNAFAGGYPMPFAMGGVLSGPTLFPMANGAGLAGEAGPEAVMPLSRDKNGKLGVSGGSGVTVNVINNAGADISVQQQTGPSGEQVIQVMVERAVVSAMGKGRFDNTLQTLYGLQRRGN